MKAFGKGFGRASIVGLFLLFLFPAASGAELLGAMRVQLVAGDVQVKIAETGEWAPASVNMPLIEGDELWVPEGSVSAIQTNNGADIRFDGNTSVQILRVDRDSFQFYLSQGRAYVLNDTPPGSVLQFDTPDTSVRAFEPSTFRIDIPNGETDVLVFRGSVTAENAGGTTRLRAGSMLVLGSTGYAELSPLPPPDNWQAWNERRDQVALARGQGYRYLPEELRVYSSDFDENGRWVYVSEYGYVWTPTVVVTSDWAPYRDGRWVWRGGDYVWVGYEPWGWAPYHYGRWSFIARIGWFWVPPSRGDVFWAPGYVGWVRTGDYVAWVPLAPREVYYGRGNYGRYSTNITNVNIRQVRVTNRYRNINARNSITVVNQTTFVTGRPVVVNRNVVVNVRKDFSNRRNIVVGSPPIKPVQTSYVPVARQIPEAKRPPAAIRKIDVKELRQSRPLVKEPDRSAIRPQAQPRPLEVKKVEQPRPSSERTRELPQVAPAERSRPQQTQPPENTGPRVAPVERSAPAAAPVVRSRPETPPPARNNQQQTAPREKASPQVAPVERSRPQRTQPPENAGPQVAPAERSRPQRTQPPENAGPRVAPTERSAPRAAPAERVRQTESPPERDRSREAPSDNGSRENPRGGTEREVERGAR